MRKRQKSQAAFTFVDAKSHFPQSYMAKLIKVSSDRVLREKSFVISKYQNKTDLVAAVEILKVQKVQKEKSAINFHISH